MTCSGTYDPYTGEYDCDKEHGKPCEECPFFEPPTDENIKAEDISLEEFYRRLK